MRKNGLTHQRVICTAHSRLDTPRSVTDTGTTMPIDSERTKTGTGDVISFFEMYLHRKRPGIANTIKAQPPRCEWITRRLAMGTRA
jgi:hypothetical protein